MGGFEIAFVEDAGGGEFHAEACGAVEPFGVCGVAAEELEAGPVEGVEVEDNGGLAGGFGVGEHLIEGDTGAVELVEVDGGGDGGDDGKFESVSIGQLERTLSAHADSEQRDEGWGDFEVLCDPGDEVVHDPCLGSDFGVEFVADDIEPPAAATGRADSGELVLLEEPSEDGVVGEADFAVAVEEEDDAGGWVGAVGLKDIDGSAIDENGLPALQEFGVALRCFGLLSIRGTRKQPFQRFKHDPRLPLMAMTE